MAGRLSFGSFTSKASMVASTAYIAAATNRFNQAADIWHGSSDLIVFGSSHLLALWDVQVRVVSALELCSILTRSLC